MLNDLRKLLDELDWEYTDNGNSIEFPLSNQFVVVDETMPEKIKQLIKEIERR